MPDVPTPAAARARRHRERRRQEVRYMCGDVPPDIVRALVESRWLGLSEADDPRELGGAMIDLVDCWMRRTLGPPKS